MTRAIPRVVISRCLGFAKCRHDGQQARAGFVDTLAQHVEVVTVCPEADIGMGTPRDPIRLVAGEGSPHLVQPSTARDYTAQMTAHAKAQAAAHADVDGFVFKTRSPSCAVDDAKVYAAAESSPVVARAGGVYASIMRERCPGALLTDEGHLTNARWRHHFLAGIHLRAEFRQTREAGSMGALVRFHARSKFLLMAANEAEMRRLGKIVANHEQRPVGEVLQAYDHGLALALAGEPNPRAERNVLQHCFGYVTRELSDAERHHFLGLLGHLAEDRLDPMPAITLLRSWIHRFDVAYLADQFYFDPYPPELVQLEDSGRR